MASKKVAVVTGGNKGIGFGIVKGLCERFDGEVYLTSRDVTRGRDAVDKLKKLGLKALYHQLDITDQNSIDSFKEYIKSKHGGLDLLVNNAAIAFKQTAKEPFSIQAKETIFVNYFSTLKLCEALFPLLRNNARVVNLSSSLGHLSQIPSVDLRSKFNSKDLDIPTLSKLMEKFVKDAEANRHKEEGWGNSAYSVSKVGVSALSIIQQRMFDQEAPNRNIVVNHVHPGYVDTDMTSHMGPLTIDEGARSALFAALDADFKGKYVWYDCTVVEWDAPNAPSQ
ncbi:carbonyl reductase [NADPH] 1-like [Cylas formicarius]|uniref:carbonyl reductase [NADPH] 1-like n=1 Tax=Cylas formicarius TaxID=197179 RepID=UPI002958D46A|nr:carbonyl reductase [NADPH] 1-like [Cylas formicarius]